MEMGIVQVGIGSVILYIEGNKLTKIELSNKKLDEKECGIFTEQIKQYFDGKRKTFDFEVKLTSGPVFQKIWDYVKKIPYGTTQTYGEIAKKLKTNPRVIGFAMASNPLPIYIPCHRVVSKKGLGGYTGGLEWKKYLLNLEKKYSQ
ncbi:MAG: methylated-DNA-[protein]-cysteine S-methyltransferase [Thermosipho sp. (in: thermotogales)]|nr:methylated-DNA-[protein]-cysteine S-methyltransferase [Thermosipho sp. (in: thermotogales)]MDN5324923.1 methylated-DNA-[protein]-cysteine S-methyltransferase [Thermosipho sp. (in: thermotogales)]